MDGGGVAGVGFVVASGDGPELFQLGEGVLDEVAPAVHLAVEADGGLAVGLGRDHRGGTTIVKLRSEPVGVERFVAKQSAEDDTLDQRRYTDGVVTLTGQQDEAHQSAEGINQGDNLGGQPVLHPAVWTRGRGYAASLRLGWFQAARAAAGLWYPFLA